MRGVQVVHRTEVTMLTPLDHLLIDAVRVRGAERVLEFMCAGGGVLVHR